MHRSDRSSFSTFLFGSRSIILSKLVQRFRIIILNANKYSYTNENLSAILELSNWNPNFISIQILECLVNNHSCLRGLKNLFHTNRSWMIFHPDWSRIKISSSNLTFIFQMFRRIRRKYLKKTLIKKEIFFSKLERIDKQQSL